MRRNSHTPPPTAKYSENSMGRVHSEPFTAAPYGLAVNTPGKTYCKCHMVILRAM